MKAIISLIGLGLALIHSQAFAKDYVLLDLDKAPQNWKMTSEELGLNPEKPFCVSVRLCTGDVRKGSA